MKNGAKVKKNKSSTYTFNLQQLKTQQQFKNISTIMSMQSFTLFLSVFHVLVRI